MDKGLDNAPKQIMAKALTFCTLARMHACTQNGLQSVVDDEETERRHINGTRDAGRVRRNREGEAPAEPKRQRVAIGDWRMVNGKWQVASGEILVFWKAVFLHCRKISVLNN